MKGVVGVFPTMISFGATVLATLMEFNVQAKVALEELDVPYSVPNSTPMRQFDERSLLTELALFTKGAIGIVNDAVLA